MQGKNNLLLTREQREIECIIKFDFVVEQAFNEFVKNNPIPRFMCQQEHQKAVDYALNLAKLGLLDEFYNRALFGAI